MVTITISGSPGSGKTTVALLLHKTLALPYVYSGDIFRSLAQKHKMSLEEFGTYCETHPEIDEELDKEQLQILQNGNVIVEGRLAGWHAYRNNIPAVKIFIQASLDTRAQRIVQREKGTVQQRKREILDREQSEQLRYQTYYDIDLFDTSIYDLLIDSSQKTPEEIVSCILHYLEK